jgi:hypothetical protein
VPATFSESIGFLSGLVDVVLAAMVGYRNISIPSLPFPSSRNCMPLLESCLFASGVKGPRVQVAKEIIVSSLLERDLSDL